MPMLRLHPSSLSAATADARRPHRQSAGCAARSRRQRRARLTAAFNAAAVLLCLAGIALIWLLS
ncbi:hypothetical protein J2Z75_000407 [Rhizobium herbae]|uniref:Peptide ABC transporter permease n=2 Tax=Rhizobium herbae TaxID=508661 RepID=A0ABS4EG57_9HYPH|nr:hypothetical protein [Rhizobium herbae]